MPIIPAAPTPTQFPAADEDTAFDVTLAVVDTAEDLVTVPATKTGRTISIVNEGPGTAYVAFDGDAALTDLELGKGDAYADDLLAISTKVSFIGESGKQPRLRGVLWSGA